MNDTTRLEFQAVYRHPERVLIAFPIAIGILACGIYYLVSDISGSEFTTASILIAGLPLLVIIGTALSAIRGYDWVLKDDGLHVHEWPRFLLLGLSRRRIVPYAQIKALRRTETALSDSGVDLVTADGASYYMSDAFGPWGKVPRRRAIPEERCEYDLDRFIQAIRMVAAAHGNGSIVLAEGLDFWSRATGIAVQVLLLLMSLAPAAGVIAMLLDGEPFAGGGTGKGSATYGAGIALALPFGVLWMLRRSLKRRALVKEG